jgi:hypothetical protein
MMTPDANEKAGPRKRKGPRDTAATIAPEWIRMPSGTTIPLAHSPARKRIVLELIERRLKSPGAPIRPRDLAERVWPGHTSPTGERLRMMMRWLRDAGLDEILIRLDAGYLINPTIPLRGHFELTPTGPATTEADAASLPAAPPPPPAPPSTP